MRQDFRCDCPITSALDVVGDKWILVIIKQMLIERKETFKDFTEADEAIATNILTAKLKFLEEAGIIIKTQRPDNKKTNLYLLTEKGLALTPVILELALWSDENLRDIHPTIVNGKEMEFLRNDKATFANAVVTKYKEKLATTEARRNGG
jgi:DNA-binding HxlR family transcriptional regulator